MSVINAEVVFEFEVSKESISFQTKPALSAAGHLYSHTVEAFLRGQSEHITNILDFLIKYKFLVALMDQDGKYIRIGDTVNGLSFKWDFSPSPNPSGENGYKLTFVGDTLSRYRPVLYPFSVY